ncbi:MAG: pilus assembly protein PilM [Bdellovibrionales bacterium]|nr:pilus assembly protein PilM [Bdellovibrionales bacterium]
MRILGIDVGKSKIKAVEIDTVFGRYEVHEYHERKLGEGDAQAAIQELLLSLPKKPDRVVTALPTSQTTFRNILLPTKDRKAIQAGLAFELEDELPFDSENLVYDAVTLSQSSAGTHLHVSSTLSARVEDHIKTYATYGIDPDLSTSEGWAFRSLFSRILSPDLQNQPVLCIHIGHEKTLIYVQWRGMPVVCREIRWGGTDLTLAICKRYGIPMDQAEKAKLDHGFVLPESQFAQASQEQKDFSICLMEPLQALIREIRQAELAAKASTNETIHRAYLSGGTSLLPGLIKRIGEDLKLTTQPLLSLTSLSHVGVTYSEQTDAEFALAAGIALSAVAGKNFPILNLRKGGLSKISENQGNSLAKFKGPLLSLSAVMTCFFFSLAFESVLYRNKITDVNTQLEKSIRNFFGSVSTSAMRNYLASPSSLKKQINSELGKNREMTRLLSPNTRSPIEFLRDLSTSIPKDMVVDVTQFQLGAAAINANPGKVPAFNPTEDHTVSVTVLVSSPQMLERVTALMDQKVASMSKTAPEDAASPFGGPKKLKVVYSGKTKEDAYGK